MEKETFDPKQYSSFEDLPAKHRDEFAPVEGGFVRSKAVATFEMAKERAGEINQKSDAEKGVLRRAFDRFRHLNATSTLNELHQDALDEDQERHAEAQQEMFLEAQKKEIKNIIDDLNIGAVRRKFDQLGSSDEKIKYADRVKSLLMEHAYTQVKDKIESMVTKKMKESGHDGLLFLKKCDMGNGCVNLTGRLDGRSIDVHSGLNGKIDSQSVSSEEGRRLIDAYQNIAIDLRNPYGHGNGDYDSVVRNALSFMYDGLFDTNFRSKGKFNASWARDYVSDFVAGAVSELKKENEQLLNIFQDIERDRASLVIKCDNERNKIAEEYYNAQERVEKERREVQIAKNIGDLLPRIKE